MFRMSARSLSCATLLPTMDAATIVTSVVRAVVAL